MSWIENVNNGYTIITGDGKTYTPFWMKASAQVEYNISEFTFREQKGSKVDRGEAKGARYSLQIFFQGEDHLEEAEEFRQSADDKRPWTISHPYYGRRKVHPVSLSYNNDDYNITKITGTIIETISDTNPQVVDVPQDKVNEDKDTLDDTVATAFSVNVTPASTQVNEMGANNDNFYNEAEKNIEDSLEAEDYFNLYSEANTAIINATAKPLAAMQAIQAFINAPALFTQSVSTRLGILDNQFTALRNTLTGIDNAGSKRVYEATGVSLISAMAVAAANPQDDDYESRIEVVDTVESILAQYNQLIEDLDSLQTNDGGDPDSYIPDADGMIRLSNLVSYTVSQLFIIALDAKQERTVLLEKDSNVIVLAHRFYGLEADDSTIDEFIETNNIGLNELLGLKKDREVKYYV